MIKAAIEKILDLAPVEQFNLGGRIFTSKPVTEIKTLLPSAMTVNTLTGLADYLNENPDNLVFETLLVHVVDTETVALISSLQQVDQQRAFYVFAKHQPLCFQFGKYIPVEEFIIALQTYFVPSDTIDRMIRLVGNLVVEASVKHLDDGVSQEVTAKMGITKVENVQVPNPVQLAPYRTFLEVEQPASKFVFRIKKGSDGAPTCALFAADGGNWKLDAVQGIAQWLKAEIRENVTILA